MATGGRLVNHIASLADRSEVAIDSELKSRVETAVQLFALLHCTMSHHVVCVRHPHVHTLRMKERKHWTVRFDCLGLECVVRFKFDLFFLFPCSMEATERSSWSHVDLVPLFITPVCEQPLLSMKAGRPLIVPALLVYTSAFPFTQT